MEEVINRRRVTRSFKTRGLTLHASALEGVISVLTRENPKEAEVILRAIVEACKQRGGRIVTQDLLANVVSDLTRDAKDVNDESMQLLNAFETPRLQYDSMRKQFSLHVEGSASLFGEANDKVDMFAQRFALIRQRILKQDVFRPKLVTADGRQASSDPRHVTHSLTTIESLLGRSGVRFLLGMLVQGVEEGQYCLEDHTAQVPLDMSDSQLLTEGILTQYCVVLVEGEMIDGVLNVHRMGNPIVESRREAIQDIGLKSTDIFQSISTQVQLEDVRSQEALHGPDGMFVVLSNVHLDRPHVMEKLRTLFEGFRDANPIYVLMGNFLSNPSDGKEFLAYMDELAALMEEVGVAQEGRFIFIPGPNDAGMSDVLPRPSLPKFVTRNFRQRIPHATFGTNPCRLRYFSKELVFYRKNITSELQRATLFQTTNIESTPSQHAIKTVLDQGHLCPHQPAVFWQYDHALRLYPLPDAILLGDSTDQYYETYADCDVINPGPCASGSEFPFVVYRPVASVDVDGSTKSDVEFSQIPD
mmetsp:Transcript_456/g.669  ORF Transcript_456/g.669 Transcript_456/m.669 type:complete len:530 (+) Transcript_456:135-1724(+)|eukprot:CAMPEP_0194201936 /NCGR_PEP_ID=MMETSP0156-20130528/2086_1 /TAXON_ID=33649 /ORGANISM="Thalassionema nitzschioides, Strain L26-B" /LENGTH=529 /DNA_ID=CAMNT_0038927275 /DNA_START=86 /DNA_END=1675 /DNA_ORIENTATION=-